MAKDIQFIGILNKKEDWMWGLLFHVNIFNIKMKMLNPCAVVMKRESIKCFFSRLEHSDFFSNAGNNKMLKNDFVILAFSLRR